MVEADPISLSKGMEQNEVIQYIIVRTDLGMSRGKIAAQVAHAAVECYRKLIDRAMIEEKKYQDSSQHIFPRIHNKWVTSGTKKVVLDGGSLSQFEALTSSLDDDIISHIVVDQGRTEIEPDTITCVGVGPDFDKKITPMFKHLELL